MGIFGAAIKGFGKALKASKRKKRRKDLGLPERTKLQQRSAAGFVKLKKKMNKDKPDLVKQSGPSKTQVVGFGAAAGAGAGALATIKKNKPVKKAMGGEAGESLRKGTLFKEKRDKRRQHKLTDNQEKDLKFLGKGTNRIDRYRIPPELIRELFVCCI